MIDLDDDVGRIIDVNKVDSPHFSHLSL
jgi:hypothetical protein